MEKYLKLNLRPTAAAASASLLFMVTSYTHNTPLVSGEKQRENLSVQIQNSNHEVTSVAFVDIIFHVLHYEIGKLRPSETN